MHCPRCKYPNFPLVGTCPQCGFHGDPDQIEELSRLTWLLGEINAWVEHGIVKRIPQRIQKYYLDRYQNTRVRLGLYYEPFTEAEALEAWHELRRYELLFQQIGNWLQAGLLKTGFLPTYYSQLIELRARVGNLEGPLYPESNQERLEEVNFLLDAIYDLNKREEFTTTNARWSITSPLVDEKTKLEKILHPPIEVKPKVVATPVEKTLEPQPESVPPSPPAPRPPLRERFWRSILSERTLQALLFLGIFLLFVAAISFVIWGWKDFSAPVRVSIPIGFTILFFGLGHAVRVRTELHRSALALSAIAALWIPIDCYTIYANYGSPPKGWPEFWLLTSFACLVAYILAALQIQSRFFGYITGVAAGSAILAILEAGTDISRDWYTAALSVLAVGLLLLAIYISKLANAGRWKVFAEPFRYLALWTPAILMPLTLGLRLVTRDTYDALHYAMTVNWFLGGFVFAWGAVQYRSRSLGILSAIALPVSIYMAQGALFDYTRTNPAWQAFGLACLTPLYMYAGRRLSAYKEDEVLLAHGKTATRWGIVLITVSALFALTDLTSGTAAAATHTVLMLTSILIAILWQQPRTLFAASLFSFTAATFAMSELNLSLNQLSVGWVSLAILHILVALRLALQRLDRRTRFLPPLVIAAYVIAALAILPPALIYDGHLVSYALGNWIVLSAWGAYLAYRKQPGFLSSTITGRLSILNRLLTTGAIYHWFTVLPLPFWVWIVTKNNQAAGYVLPSLLTALAWFMVILSHRLGTLSREFRIPWRFAGLMVSAAAIITAFINVPEGYTPAIVLLLTGILYFVDTFLLADRSGFYFAGMVTAWGLWMLLTQADADSKVITFCLGVLIAIYILGGLELERRKIKGITYHFLSPLYMTAHVLALIVLFRIYLQPLNELLVDSPWTKAMQLWGAADQLLLAVVYAAFAWGRYQEWWGHLAAWLSMIGGGFVAIVYSEGHGSLAAKGAMIAVVMILAERTLFWWKRQRRPIPRVRAVWRLAWNLYRRPLLVAGWTASVGIIFLSLVRNLIWLGGGRVQQIWAAAGLLIIVFLYAFSAFLFRKARFVWFAVLVLFAPWTILTNLGWFTSYKPTLTEFAISWVVLGWLLFGISLWLQERAVSAYVRPLKTVTHFLLPYSMLWAIADTRSSLYTVGLSIALYAASAWLNHRQAQRGAAGRILLRTTKFFYPVAGLIPLWSLYWLDYLVPTARHEHFGIVLLAFGSLGLFVGNRLEGIAPRFEWKRAYGLPAYLVAYVSLIFGILMVAHRLEWLSLALLYAAILMLVSAWLFKNSLWMYPMSIAAALALWTALQNANVPMDRRGWWLIGLAAVHLICGWRLRRNQVNAYAVPLIAMGFVLIAFGLPPSSLDQIGAIWGYGGAALLYAISAFWLQQPLLLFPAGALIIVPYGTILYRSTIPAEYYGLSLFPGALLSLYLGWILDHRKGEYKNFPWEHSNRWFTEILKRLFQWWALPLHILGLGLASAAPFFAAGHSNATALYFLFLAIIYGWAVFRFKLRLWLVLGILAAHYALAAYLDTLGLWRTVDGAWLRFLPLTAALLAVGLFLEKYFHEEPPTNWNRWLSGWSRPFYLFVFFDIVISEVASLRGTYAGADVSLINSILIAVMASFWGIQDLSYLSPLLSLIALSQWRAAGHLPGITLPTHLAGLALGFGVIGFGYTLVRRQPVQASQNTTWHSVWEIPLQRSAIVISFLALGLAPYRGVDILGWSVRALFGLSFREIVEAETVFMLIWVLSLIGFLYIAAAAVYRRMRLGYLAVAMLLLSWFLYTFYINAWDTLRQLQWYAIPSGIYLLSIGYLEWLQRHKRLARWLDYVGILLLFGSLFWQTLVFGWSFALLLGAEGLIAFWWGSARRLRRFFYAGMAGVILATLGQLLNALQEINQWITFGLMGLLLVLVAIIVERRLEAIKAWQQVLETWE